MTKLEQIMDLLRDRELTSLEIASEINIPKSNCSSYLNTLYNDGRIKRISDKRPFKYKIATKPIELLKQLYDFMSKIDLGDYIPNDKEIKLVEQIKEIFR